MTTANLTEGIQGLSSEEVAAARAAGEANTGIGIIQELRSKKLTDRPSIVASSKARVIRNGKQTEVPHDELVRGDCIMLGRATRFPAIPR